MSNGSALNQASIQKYQQRAKGYDDSAQFTMDLRRQTIGLLQLQPGDVVLDVGAGTGLSFGLLRDGVNAGANFESADGHGLNQKTAPKTGRVLAFEQSPEMFALGPKQMPAAGLERRLEHLRQAKPGARIAMAGMKFFPWWPGPLNLLAWAKNRPYNALAL